MPLKVKLLIVLMSADSASANLSCMHALRALHTVAVPIFSYWHFEPCGVHQLMRSTVKTGVLTRQKAIMKSQCKLLKTKLNRKAFEKEVLKQYTAHFDFNGVSLTPAQELERTSPIAATVELLSKRLFAQKHLASIRPDIEERMGLGETALEQFLEFYNDCLPSSGRWGAPRRGEDVRRGPC